MSFNSFQYLIFFPIVLLLYYVCPKRFRYIWLLMASCFFYMQWNRLYILLLFYTIAVTYICGRLVEYFKQHKKTILAKVCLTVSIILNLGMLFGFKYINFFLDNINALFHCFSRYVSLPNFDIILPVGISFFTFQAIGYIVDVYKEDVSAEKNFLKYALFVSFFPQLVAGPIERSRNLLVQINKSTSYSLKNVKEGIIVILFGLFQKIVIADNIALIIDPVFNDYGAYRSEDIILSILLFGIQIYCDFGGYSSIAIGSAQILGYNLMENFKAPYFAQNVHDFWKRWHISLTAWFRDYVYIPLGGNKCGKIRKYVNKAIVFLLSGLWHGADWSYIVWGGVNGLYQIAEEIMRNLFIKLNRILKLNRDGFDSKIVHSIITYLLIDFGWLFFRADSISDAMQMIGLIFKDWEFKRLFTNNLFNIFDNSQNIVVLGLSIGLLFFVDALKEKGHNFAQYILKSNLLFKWGVLAFMLLFIIVFGAYGEDYVQTKFIYFQF